MGGFSNINPKTGGNDSLRMEEVIELYQFPHDDWAIVRFIQLDKLIKVTRHWVNIHAKKQKKIVSIPFFCIATDVEKDGAPRVDEDGNEIECPFCGLNHGKKEDGATSSYENFYLANAIIREIQEDEPRKKGALTKQEKKTGLKDIRNKSWTPVRVLRLPATLANRIQEIEEGNTVKKDGKKKQFPVDHPRYGLDIRIKYKPKASGTDKYSADSEERVALTKEEQEYLVWDLSDNLLNACGRLTTKQAKEELKRMDLVGTGVVDDEDDDDDDDAYDLGKKKKKKKSAKKSKSFDDDDEDDEDDVPSKKKKKKSSTKKKSAKKSKSFDDDDDDDDAPWDDDEDTPKKKKKTSTKKTSTKKKSSKKSKSTDDDDDDFDLDEGATSPKKKKKSSKTSSSKKPVKKKKKRSSFDDDDE